MRLRKNKIYVGDCLEVLKKFPDKSIHCCVTSPPYFGLRDYGTAIWVGGYPSCNHEKAKIKTRYDYSLDSSTIQDGKRVGTDGGKWGKICPACGAVNLDKQVGLEETPEAFVQKLVEVFREVKRVLRDDGTLWLNLGDSYYNYRGENDYQSKQTISTNNAHQMLSGSGKRNVKNQNLKGKDLIGIPWMVAFALRADGWYLRQDIIWHKPNPMPESVTDRCTKAHEYIFLLTKKPKYYYDYEAVQEEATGYDGRKDTMFKGGVKYAGFNQQSMLSRGHERWKYKNLNDKGQTTHTMHENRAKGLADELTPIRNKRSVWTVNTKPYKEAHFATFPELLIKPCILAGCPVDGIVLDPFMGAGTTGKVCKKLHRNYVGIELNEKYAKMAEKRINRQSKTLFAI